MFSILSKTFLEIIMAATVVYMYLHQKELIMFEHYLKMVIVVNYRRYKKRKRAEQLRKQRLERARRNRQLRVVAPVRRPAPADDNGFFAA
ncbi:MAG: hypothetical protein E7514_03850 [Ruminococcaceae bacterium]|nr:hypothetical protein [Oscillospiraceae bacterium]